MPSDPAEHPRLIDDVPTEPSVVGWPLTFDEAKAYFGTLTSRLDSTGRIELEFRLKDAVGFGLFLLDERKRLLRLNRELNDNVTAVQTRCTELVNELRQTRRDAR
jgi:hypothetical protein